MSTESDNIRANVSRILESCGLSFVVTYRGESRNALGGTHAMDQWTCVFSNSKGQSEEFDFFTGLGLRADATPRDRVQAKFSFPGLTENDIKRRTNWGRQYLAKVESLRKPKAPHPADILHSVMLDASAAGQTFESWCSEFGYDTDSRKAFATYEACQQNADKLRRIIPMGLAWSDLELALQDY